MPRPKGFVMAQSQRDSISVALRAYHATRLRPVTEIDYASLHRWLRRHHPKNSVCEECGAEESTDFALRLDRAYSRDRADYRELCRSCHWEQDKADTQHGTSGMYKRRRCRCDACRAWNAEQSRARKRRLRGSSSSVKP